MTAPLEVHELPELMRRLAAARRSYAAGRDDLSREQQRFDLEHAATIRLTMEHRLAVQRLEEEVRVAALEAYQRTGSKAPAPGVKIRLEHQVLYDADEAFEWARSTRLCLQLDSSAFEKTAIANPGLVPCAKVTEQPAATIARDLGPAVQQLEARRCAECDSPDHLEGSPAAERAHRKGAA